MLSLATKIVPNCKFKLLKSKKSNPFYGDICRKRNAKGYRCPKGCFKTEDGKSPFCQSSKTNKAPCRTGMYFIQTLQIESNIVLVRDL